MYAAIAQQVERVLGKHGHLEKIRYKPRYNCKLIKEYAAIAQ